MLRQVIKKYKKIMIITFILTLSLLSFGFNGSEKDRVKVIKTVRGKSFGFFLDIKGHFLTNSHVIKGLVSGEIIQSEHVTDKADLVVESPLEGFSILKVDGTYADAVYPLGDSDSVDISDELTLPGSGKGKVLFKLNNFNDYKFPCIVANFPYKKKDIGKPVLDCNNRVIGLFISYKNNYVILPINRIKPYIEQSIKINRLPKGFTKKLVKKMNTQSDFSSMTESGSPEKKIATEKVLDIADQTPIPEAQYGGNEDYHFGSIDDFAFDKRNNLYIIDTKYHEIKKIFLTGLAKELSLPEEAVIIPPKIMDKPEESDKKGAQTTPKKAQPKTKETKGEKPENEKKVVEEKKEPEYKIVSLDMQKYKAIKRRLSNPISLAISSAQLIFVLDSGSKKIIVFNRDLTVVYEMSFKEISQLFNPLKIRAFREEIFIISDTNRLYHLEFDKKKMKMKVRPIQKKGNRKWKIPQFVDLDSQGNKFYWLDKKNHQVFIVNKRRELIKTFPIKEKFPTSLSIHRDKLYIFDESTNKLGIYTRNGRFIRYWGGEISTKEGNPKLAKINSAGVIAVGYENFSHIRLYHLNGKFIKDLSPFSRTNREVKLPLSIALDKHGRLSIVTGKSNVHLFPTLKMPPLNREAKFMSNISLDVALRGITISSGQVYIADTLKDRILAFPKSRKTEVIAFRGKELGELNQPIQMASSNKMIYIVDKLNHRIVKINESGVFQGTFLTIDKHKHLLYPQDVAVTTDGKILVLAENKVLVFNRSGKFASDFDIEGGQNSYLGYAKGIAYDSGVIYVADTYNNRVLRYRENGSFIDSFGEIGGGKAQANKFHQPWDIIVNNHNIYIVDSGNHRIVKYRYEIEKHEVSTDGELKPDEEKMKK